jgi:hypothetical protein
MTSRFTSRSGAIAALSFATSAVALAGTESTAVHVFKPVAPATTSITGQCWTTSIATDRPGAYRCMNGNAISDPCFTTDKPAIVVCDADPSKGRPGFAMRAKGSLPPSEAVAGPYMPWLIKLADGTTCTPFTGTRPFVGKLVIGYGCSPAKAPAHGSFVGLADSLNMKPPLWLAKRVIYRDTAAGSVLVSATTVPIAAAWR